MAMCKAALALACLAGVYGRRVQTSMQSLTNSQFIESQMPEVSIFSQSLAEIRHSSAKTGASNTGSFWQSADVQRVLMFLCIIAIGKMLQSRFPQKEPGAIQKFLLQFLLPAVLFKGLSKQKIELGHMVYLGGGIVNVLVRVVGCILASYAAFGFSSGSETAKLRRTAIFEISSMGTALSVLPFAAEFVGAEYVGLGAMIDIPMKVYILILMPVLIRKFAPPSGDSNSSEAGKPKATAALALLAKDPMTLSVVFGVIYALATQGAGTEGLGFVGKAIDALAAGQAPCLFLLIGLNLSLASSTPLFCVVLLFATQGILLIMVWLLLLVVNTGDAMGRFIILLMQGAPMFTVAGIMSAAADTGVQGYAPGFALDIVGMAFPISSFFQCVAGIMGTSYPPLLPIVGAALIAIAALLRIVFKAQFQLNEPDGKQTERENVHFWSPTRRPALASSGLRSPTLR